MLRIAVIGVGAMGKNHARVCSELENVELVGVVDINREVAKKVAQRLGTEVFFDHREIIPKIDAGIVATPTKTHYKITMDLLKKGKHVLVEKPICGSIEEAERIVRFAEEEGLILAVGHIEKYNPVVKFVKEALDRGRFGDVITLTSKRVSNFPGRIRDVGVILDLGIHDIDIMRFLVGEAKSVYARAGRFNRNIGFEDHANIVLNFETGISGIIEVNWLTPMKVRKLFLTCSKNFVEVDYMEQSITISSSSFKEMDDMNLYHIPVQYNINRVTLEKREPLKNEIKDFIESINKQKKPLATGEDGLMALKIAKAAIESYKKGKVVKI